MENVRDAGLGYLRALFVFRAEGAIFEGLVEEVDDRECQALLSRSRSGPYLSEAVS